MTDDIQLRLVRALPFEGNTAWNYRGICDVHHTIYYILAGDGHIRTEKGALDLEPGRVYLIPRGLPHDLWCDTHIRKTYMDFHVELFPGCDALTEAGEVRSLPAGREVCQRIFDAAQRKTLRDRTFLRGQLLTAVAAFMPDNLPGISPCDAALFAHRGGDAPQSQCIDSKRRDRRALWVESFLFFQSIPQGIWLRIQAIPGKTAHRAHCGRTAGEQ